MCNKTVGRNPCFALLLRTVNLEILQPTFSTRWARQRNEHNKWPLRPQREVCWAYILKVLFSKLYSGNVLWVLVTSGNTRIVPTSRRWPLASESLPVYHSPTILDLDSIIKSLICRQSWIKAKKYAQEHRWLKDSCGFHAGHSFIVLLASCMGTWILVEGKRL